MKLKLGKMSMGTALEYSTKGNAHVFMSGKSGYGKSWEMRLLVKQIPEQHGRTIILDFSGDFQKPYPEQEWDPKKAEIIDVRSGEFGLNPFVRKEGETADDVADRVMDMLESGLKLTPASGPMFVTLLQRGWRVGVLLPLQILLSALRWMPMNMVSHSACSPRFVLLAGCFPRGEGKLTGGWMNPESPLWICPKSGIEPPERSLRR